MSYIYLLCSLYTNFDILSSRTLHADLNKENEVVEIIVFQVLSLQNCARHGRRDWLLAGVLELGAESRHSLLDDVVCVDGNAHAEGYPQPDGREAVHSQHAAVDDDGHLLPVLSDHSRQLPLLRLILEFLSITVNTALFSHTIASHNMNGQRDI